MTTTNTKGALVALHSALERVTDNFRLMLAGKPVRDVSETLAEAAAALQAHSPPAPAVASETAAGAVTNKQIMDCFADTTADGAGAYLIAVGRAILALATPPAAASETAAGATDQLQRAFVELGLARPSYGTEEGTRANKAISFARKAIHDVLATPPAAATKVLSEWKLVPIEPTKEMIDAGHMHTMRADEEEPYRARGEAIACYSDMLAAAPPAGSDKEPS